MDCISAKAIKIVPGTIRIKVTKSGDKPEDAEDAVAITVGVSASIIVGLGLGVTVGLAMVTLTAFIVGFGVALKIPDGVGVKVTEVGVSVGSGLLVGESVTVGTEVGVELGLEDCASVIVGLWA